jgi:hypothetical protein
VGCFEAAHMPSDDNEQKLKRIERFARELLRKVLGMELNDDPAPAEGVCLRCGSAQKGPVSDRCRSCQREFRSVAGLFGTNNISQLLASLEDLKSGDITLAAFEEHFGVFLEIWEKFADSWGIQTQQLTTLFKLEHELAAVYGKLLDEIEDGLDQLTLALEIVEELEPEDLAPVDTIEDNIRLFSRRVCSATAGMFTKLESREGDFGSLLDAFESF